MQKADENLDSFITRLKTLVKECDYHTERDDAIRDQIVFGCKENKLREKFLREETVTLAYTLNICQAHQASQKQMSMIRNENLNKENSTINKVNLHKPRPRHNASRPNKEEDHNDKTSYNLTLRKCKYCGHKHIWNKNDCPAYGKQCNKCKMFNHFESQCKKKRLQG